MYRYLVMWYLWQLSFLGTGGGRGRGRARLEARRVRVRRQARPVASLLVHCNINHVVFLSTHLAY